MIKYLYGVIWINKLIGSKYNFIYLQILIPIQN